MDSKTFFDNFETIANAPGGISRLRELILDLAVRGKLVPQNAEEGSTSLLLSLCAESEELLVKHGLINQPRFQRGQPTVEIPYPIPSAWRWVRLGDILAVVGGGTPSTTNPTYWTTGEDIPWITPADMRSQASRYVSRGSRDITKLGLEGSSAQLLPAGSVLFSSRAPIGHVGIAAKPLATNQGFKSCVPYLADMSEFIYLFLKKAGKEIDAMATGTTFREVSGKQVAQVLIPVPPIGEQKRIVTKVDELMTLCDELEATQTQRNSIRAAARKSAIDAISTAMTPDELNTAWKRISNNWPIFGDSPDCITSLRRLILDLLMSGNYFEEGNQSSTWAFRKFGDLGECRLGKMLDKAKNTGDLYSYLRNTNVQWFRIQKSDIASMRVRKNEVEAFSLKIDDLLICEGGQPGRCAIVSKSEEGLLFQKALHRFRPNESTDVKFVAYALLRSTMNGTLEQLFTGVTIRHLTGQSLKAFEIYLPQLNEQKIITAKVSELMALCNELENSLFKQNDLMRKLSGAMVADVVA